MLLHVYKYNALFIHTFIVLGIHVVFLGGPSPFWLFSKRERWKIEWFLFTPLEAISLLALGMLCLLHNVS